MSFIFRALSAASLVVFTHVAFAALPSLPDPAHLSSYVVPLTGTAPPGFVNPGPFVPFGMVQPGPDTEGPLNYGGYFFVNNLITGFSHVHMSSGVPKGGQISIMPISGTPTHGDLASYGDPNPVPFYASPFSHAFEDARADYYSVNLTRYDVLAEVTATERAAIHRYTWRLPTARPKLVLAVGHDLGGLQSGTATLRSDGAITGYIQTGDGYKVFYGLRLSAPFSGATLAGGVPMQVDATWHGGDLTMVLSFGTLTRPLIAKVGISYVDEAGALRNVDSEIPNWDFDAVRAKAAAKWDAALKRIELTGGTPAGKQAFYTAMARALQFPNLLSDVDGRYPGPDNVIHQSSRPHYSEFSLWDSYRGQNQLLAEIVPDVYRDMINSLLDFSKQAGYLPRWQQAQRDPAHMSGDPVIPFIGEAMCRGMIAAADQQPLLGAMIAQTNRRAGEIALGYDPVPDPSLADELQGGAGRTGTTLEYGIADFSLATMLNASDPATAAAIAQRSLNYRNLMDPPTHFIRPRLADGSWLAPFRPELGYGFQEGTSWQYTWLTMHDYAGLFSRMDPVRAQRRLDTFFGFPADATPLALQTVQNQITVFGTEYYGNQFAPGNEHDLEAPYAYDYLGVPWKTQIAARGAASIYTPTPQGLPGNDDLGALSGWLVWTMLGVYPMNPGTPLFVLGAPQFQRAVIHRPGGDFVITTSGMPLTNPFVTGAALNGVASSRAWFVMPRSASTLSLTVAPAPSTTWGTSAADLPPSLSTSPLSAFGCRPN
ncbi:MAG TPA: GH92 family glycosyl hydrolase [Nevskiaceae bacterium]|nr:GH92 family glycosyl hydrolase [Nevskiaceae bacterium]